jgi:putative inorganic carbon (HCO3(-)) transporter
MGFFLFLLVNATLFIRPGEIVPDMEGWPIYQWVILGCLVVAYPRVFDQFTRDALVSRPITVCVIGMWLATMLSLLIRMATIEAREFGFEFAKVILYYLLLVAVVDTPERLRKFLVCLAGFISILAVIGVLQYHGWIEMASLTTLEERRLDPESGEFILIPRLRATGIFNDPNDLCLVLGMGILISLYFLGDKRQGSIRLIWLTPLALFGYTLILTKSRGGLIGVAAGLFILGQTRYGWRKALTVAMLCLPVFLLLGGRQANIDLGDKEDTAQARIQLWAEGFALFRHSPLFGISANKYAEEMGLVAHNSFVHGYVELGLIGGTMFVGAFFCALAGLWRMRSEAAGEGNTELLRLRSYIMAMVIGYGVGLLSLSRNYVVPTYLALGLATIYLRVSAEKTWMPALTFDRRLMKQLAMVSMASVAVIYLSIRLLGQWG